MSSSACPTTATAAAASGVSNTKLRSAGPGAAARASAGGRAAAATRLDLGVGGVVGPDDVGGGERLNGLGDLLRVRGEVGRAVALALELDNAQRRRRLAVRLLHLQRW